MPKFEDSLTNTFGEAYQSLSLDAKCALGDDLWAVMTEGAEEIHSWEAAAILSLRIGGRSALKLYTDCLLAGIARRQLTGGGK